MTNADKYLKDGVENIESLIKDFFHFVGCVEDSNRYNNIYQFFLSESKPTLTEDEKVILKRIKNSYTYIKRTDTGFIRIISGTLPGAEIGTNLSMFDNNLFQFIQPRRRI